MVTATRNQRRPRRRTEESLPGTLASVPPVFISQQGSPSVGRDRGVGQCRRIRVPDRQGSAHLHPPTTSSCHILQHPRPPTPVHPRPRLPWEGPQESFRTWSEFTKCVQMQPGGLLGSRVLGSAPRISDLPCPGKGWGLDF